MNDTVASLFIAFLWLLIGLIVVRALLSWFPGGFQTSIGRFVFQLTEPLLEPIRRLLPRTGVLDLSAMIVIILLYVAQAIVQRAANA